MNPCPKPQRNRSAKYLQWVKTQRCVYCGSTRDIDPHHLPLTNQTRRSVDLGNVVPICRTHHNFLHKKPDEERLLLKILKQKATQLLTEWQKQKGEL